MGGSIQGRRLIDAASSLNTDQASLKLGEVSAFTKQEFRWQKSCHASYATSGKNNIKTVAIAMDANIQIKRGNDSYIRSLLQLL